MHGETIKLWNKVCKPSDTTNFYFIISIIGY